MSGWFASTVGQLDVRLLEVPQLSGGDGRRRAGRDP